MFRKQVTNLKPAEPEVIGLRGILLRVPKLVPTNVGTSNMGPHPAKNTPQPDLIKGKLYPQTADIIQLQILRPVRIPELLNTYFNRTLQTDTIG
jgi:hypothetical protein